MSHQSKIYQNVNKPRKQKPIYCGGNMTDSIIDLDNPNQETTSPLNKQQSYVFDMVLEKPLFSLRLSYYNFAASIRGNGEKSSCSDPKYVQFETNITNPKAVKEGNLPLQTIIIGKGNTSVMIGEKVFTSKLDGNYDFCVRAVVINEQTVSIYFFVCFQDRYLILGQFPSAIKTRSLSGVKAQLTWQFN